MTLRRALALLAFLAVFCAADAAFANLTVAPIRVVMEGRARSTVLLLLNSDSKAHTYRVGWKLQKADEDGQYHDLPIDPNDPNIVPNMVVFSPRQVRIEPNGRQNVRLSLRQPANLPPGEYRAHLQFDALPDEEEPGAKRAPDEKGASLQLKFLIGVSVPVIVRTGGAPGEVVIQNPSLTTFDGTGKQGLKLEVAHKQGANSAYGRILVYAGDKQIGLVNNVALYPEQEKRNLAVPLETAPPSGGKVRIVYEGAGEYRGKVFAEKEIVISK